MPKAVKLPKTTADATRTAPTPPEPPSPLAKEIRKKGPFQTAEQETYLNLLRTVSVLAEDFVKLMKKQGLSESTYNALRILRGSGEAGRSCSQIAVDMVARVPDITRIVDRLEQAGLASRSRETADRRVVMVHITQKGNELLARLDEPVIRTHREQLGHFSKADLAQLNDLLVRARRAPWREIPAE